jgi:hypothetical protein
MDDYPSNNKKRPEPKKIERIVEGKVVRREKSLGKKTKEFLFGADARENMRLAWLNVLVPGAKDIVFDYGKELLERRLFGESKYGGSRRTNQSSLGYGAPGHIQYTSSNNRYSQNTPRDSHREDSRDISDRGRSLFNFDEIILQTRVEANETINQLFELVANYEVASVADLYKMLGIIPKHTDQKWGWMDLRGASFSRVHGGFLLDLPKPVPIDN